MSAAVVEQVKQLISQLPVAEKVGLAEWLEATLPRDSSAKSATKRKSGGKTTKSTKPTAQPVNGAAIHAAVAEIPWEERSWTQEEIQELMRPDPKTGAEIVALLDQLDLHEWQEMDIPDVVEWLKKQRHEEAMRRGIYWDDGE